MLVKDNTVFEDAANAVHERGMADAAKALGWRKTASIHRWYAWIIEAGIRDYADAIIRTAALKDCDDVPY